jgi:uncharacterized protein (TIGR02217 family)
MSFHDVRFPVDISFKSNGGPEFSTSVAQLGSGYEQRNINWSKSRNRYNVSWGVKTNEQLQALISFFYARQGKAYGFRYKDWSDFISARTLIGTGDAGGETEYQIFKQYNSGAENYIRNLNKPIEATVQAWINEISTTAFTVDDETGLITFNSAPPENEWVEVACEFDVPVRFDIDYLPTSLDEYNNNSALDIRLLEVRV